MRIRMALTGLLLAASPALAQDYGSGYAAASGPLIADRPLALSEIRGGVMWHQFIGPKSADEGSLSANFEVLINGPWARPTRGFWDNLTNPRLMAGATVNTSGYTSFVYGGLDWNFALTDRWYLGAGLGLGISDGETDNVPGRIDVGCSVGGFAQLNLAYRVTERWSVMGTFQHISNGGLCEPNHGINTLGVRAGYRF